MAKLNGDEVAAVLGAAAAAPKRLVELDLRPAELPNKLDAAGAPAAAVLPKLNEPERRFEVAGAAADAAPPMVDEVAALDPNVNGLALGGAAAAPPAGVDVAANEKAGLLPEPNMMMFVCVCVL